MPAQRLAPAREQAAEIRAMAWGPDAGLQGRLQQQSQQSAAVERMLPGTGCRLVYEVCRGRAWGVRNVYAAHMKGFRMDEVSLVSCKYMWLYLPNSTYVPQEWHRGGEGNWSGNGVGGEQGRAGEGRRDG